MNGQFGRATHGPLHAPIRRTDSQGQFKPDRTTQFMGLQIRTGRRCMGKSRQELADELGGDLHALTSYEHGSREAPAVTMARIAAALNKPMPWFSHQAGSTARLPDVVPPVAQTAPDAAPKLRVLLVDDAPDVLVILGAFMESAGFEVVKASSGDEALRLIASNTQIHAVVTDNIMPGLSGTDLLLQAAQLRPEIPGLIITGCARDANGLGELPSSIRVLSKPFRRQELVSRIREMTEVKASQEVSSDS